MLTLGCVLCVERVLKTIVEANEVTVYIYIYGMGESGFNFGGQRARANVILVLRECIWNATAVSLAPPTSI